LFSDIVIPFINLGSSNKSASQLKMKIVLSLFQPDIAANVGAAMRLCACMGVPLHLIEPFGFPWDERKVRQVAMDYREQVDLTRHISWQMFLNHCKDSRIVLLTTQSATDYRRVEYQPGDVLLLGRESAGVPPEVHARADLRITIPMAGKARSLNVTHAGAMVLGEALRQLENPTHETAFSPKP
jgi:tRNA (cytidine/uridine-2'-O-)-methyltransferase